LTISLKDQLVSIPQRELAGSRTSSLFAYQKNWALSELIESHMKDADYVFAFEFHDDVLILDSETNPTKLKFVQVKTKSTGKNWTIKQLINSKKGTGSNPDQPSIVGKLYENRRKFAGYENELKFITNAHFSFGSSTLKINAGSLQSELIDSIVTAVDLQLGDGTLDDINCLSFERSPLSVEDHENHIKGKLHVTIQRSQAA